MTIETGTDETYDNLVIREDLQEQYSMISPEETPFQMMAARKSVSQPQFDWPVLELAAVDTTNGVIEGEDSPAADAATLALRMNNYTQISDKVSIISHSAQASDAAADNVQRMAKQIVIKMKEMKRDKETLLLLNNAAVPGSSGPARETAGFPAWIRTNFESDLSAGSATAPTLNNTTYGYPDAAWTFSTPTASTLTELNLNDVIEECWNEGAEPSIIMCRGGDKRTISNTFTGNSTRYKDSVDKKLVASIDFYDSDFGELTVVPNRFQPELDTGVNGVYIMDPEYVRLVWCEYGLQVDNEKAHGIVVGTDNVAATS